jgi:DNA repair ATPase RecN
MTQHHTPGPWTLNETARQYTGQLSILTDRNGDNNEHICVVTNTNQFSEQDARLIAAAPDLLEALDEVRHEISRLNRAAGETVFNPAATEQVEEAIAKARGD